MADREGLSMAVAAASEDDAIAMVRLALGNMGLPAASLMHMEALEPGVWEFVIDAAAMRVRMARARALERRRGLGPRGRDVIAEVYAASGKVYGEW